MTTEGCVEVIKCPTGKNQQEWNIYEPWEGWGWPGDSRGSGRVRNNEGKAGKIPIWREFGSSAGVLQRREELTSLISPCCQAG